MQTFKQFPCPFKKNYIRLTPYRKRLNDLLVHMASQPVKPFIHLYNLSTVKELMNN